MSKNDKENSCKLDILIFLELHVDSLSRDAKPKMPQKWTKLFMKWKKHRNHQIYIYFIYWVVSAPLVSLHLWPYLDLDEDNFTEHNNEKATHSYSKVCLLFWETPNKSSRQAGITQI